MCLVGTGVVRACGAGVHHCTGSVRDFSSGFAREVQLPSPFFWQLLNQFEDRMERHANQIRLLEQMLLPHRSGRAVYDDDGAGDVSMYV